MTRNGMTRPQHSAEYWAEKEAAVRTAVRAAYEAACRNGYQGRQGNPQGYKIMAFWGGESNPFANPETANNGGGYSQPCGGASVLLEDGEILEVWYEDLSCGDFGTRRRISLDVPGFSWNVTYGTMDDAAIMSEEEQVAIMTSCSGCLGIDAWDLVEQVADLVYRASSFEEEERWYADEA